MTDAFADAKRLFKTVFNQLGKIGVEPIIADPWIVSRCFADERKFH